MRQGWRERHGIGARRRARVEPGAIAGTGLAAPAPAGALAIYEEACRAVAAARSVDEAKDIRDKADALRVYARQAKNRDLEVDAAEIRLRAERRLGELIVDQKETVGLASGGQPYRSTSAETEGVERAPTLAEIGVDHKLSSRAQKLAAVPAGEFEETIAGWRERVSAENERVSLTLVTQGDKAQRRAAREAALGAKASALPDRRYAVILADPEWRFEPYSRATGMDRAADNHYPTSTVEEIAARPVGDIAAEDCVLFLWATAPMLPEALAVMKAWGFAYKSHLVWRKAETPPAGRHGGLVLGTGYWFRSGHELLLLGTRGNVPAPLPGTQWPSMVDAPPRRHSEKPEIFLELIEAYFPTAPKIELNRRGPPRPGWDAWGNEVQAPEEAA